ncbi:sigma-70 family RNA polymerase sigma factor [Plantactinospora endophytica]|uniref:sigma-70 family RNA polymerase sigma factor n=1 Tax=Plantactinospora endophytica TaxID=673535 RepID=UPI001EF1F734
MTTDEHAERFTLLRPLLFTIVYEILGSATESDDVLQDSYLRWAEVDLATVRDTRSYLARLVTRQALNALRASARRREDYVGPWLPEPLLLDDNDPSADVVLAESVSMAMLVLLETLSPDERAVFVLREVFGFDYDDIAASVGKSVTAVHQVAHRARAHVQARRRRFQPVDARADRALWELHTARSNDLAQWQVCAGIAAVGLRSAVGIRGGVRRTAGHHDRPLGPGHRADSRRGMKFTGPASTVGVDCGAADRQAGLVVLDEPVWAACTRPMSSGGWARSTCCSTRATPSGHPDRRFPPAIRGGPATPGGAERRALLRGRDAHCLTAALSSRLCTSTSHWRRCRARSGAGASTSRPPNTKRFAS